MFLLPFFTATTWTLIVLALSLLLLYGVWPNNHFKKMGVPGRRPWPFVGTLPYSMSAGFLKFERDCKQKFGDMWGVFDGRSPLLMVADPEMLRVILVKEFSSTFTNRRTIGVELLGPLSEGLSIVQDDRWKRIRSTISPSFTSGRLKRVFPIVERYADRLVKTLEHSEQSLEVKKFVASFSLDVMTSTSFSIDTDTTTHPDSVVSVHLRNLLKFKLWPFFVLMALPFSRHLFKLFGISFMNKESVDYFLSLVKTFKRDHKEEQSGHRDFLQLMIDSEIQESDRKNGVEPSKGLTPGEILSQAFIFIFGGYDTTSTTLSFILYNLALNPDAQHTLQREIDVNFPKDSPLTYETLMNLEYLDNVISESMRLLPTAPILDRVCKRNIHINGLDIPKGTAVGAAVTSLHRDPRFWTSPEVFNPKRFSKDSGEEINPYAYMPFGLGPRNCVGMRFAQMVMKVLLVRILQDYSLETCKETLIPLEFNSVLQPKVPIKLTFRRREL